MGNAVSSRPVMDDDMERGGVVCTFIIVFPDCVLPPSLRSAKMALLPEAGDHALRLDSC